MDDHSGTTEDRREITQTAIEAAMGPFVTAAATWVGHFFAGILIGDWAAADASEYAMYSEYALLIHRLPGMYGAENELDYYQGGDQ